MKPKGALRVRFGKLVESLSSLVSLRFPWLAAIIKRVPPRLKFWANAAVGLVVIGFGVWEFGADVRHIVAEWYGPDVIVSVLPPTLNLNQYGSRDLLYEFRYDKDKMATQLRNSDAVRELAVDGTSIAVAPYSCKTGQQAAPSGLYKLSVVVQNIGDRTAEEYKLTITFSGTDLRQPDPGIRIAHVDTDALKVDYLYQQDPEITIPSCVREEIGLFEQQPEKPSALTRSTYEELGLTRDLVILKGTLEAHLFQIVNLLVRVPEPTKRFVILYHVECANCRLFVRTASYGQVVHTISPPH